jgi:hypothetical protein
MGVERFYRPAADECHAATDLTGAVDGVKLEDRKDEPEPPTHRFLHYPLWLGSPLERG